jgi:hypothetical protein
LAEACTQLLLLLLLQGLDISQQQRAWSVPAGHSPMAGRPVLLGLLLLLCHFGVLQACGAQQRGYQSQLW